MMNTERKPTTDAWGLQILREAKAARDAAGDPIPELDEYLAWSESCAAERGTTRETAPLADTHNVPLRDRGYSSGRVDPATDKQIWLINKLYDELRWAPDDRTIPSRKSDASKWIDQLKVYQAREQRSTPRIRPATERQLGYLRDLLRDRDWAGDAEVTTVNEQQDDEISFAAASAAIDRLMTYPRRARGAAPTHGIREGRYAHTTDNGETADHYRVTRDGKIMVWSAGGEWPYNGEELNEALTWIKNNPREAAALFGQLTETCGRCGRALSNDDSRKIGLGPDCANKTEW